MSTRFVADKNDKIVDLSGPEYRAVRGPINELIRLAERQEDLVDGYEAVYRVLRDARDTEQTKAEIEAEWRVLKLNSLETLTAAQIAELLGHRDVRGLSHSLRRSGAAVAFKQGRSYVFPAFQFEATGLIPTCREINILLRADIDQRGVLAWWLEPNPRLNDTTPAEALVSSPHEVWAVAQDLVESDSY